MNIAIERGTVSDQHALRCAAEHGVRTARQDAMRWLTFARDIGSRSTECPHPEVFLRSVVLPKTSRVVGKLRHPRRRLRLLARGAKHPQGAGGERQPTHHGKDRSGFFLEG